MIDPEWFITISGTVIVLVVIGFAASMYCVYCCLRTVPKKDPVPESQKVIHMGGMEVVHHDYDDGFGFETSGPSRVDMDLYQYRNRTRDYGTWIQPDPYNCYSSGPIRQSD